MAWTNLGKAQEAIDKISRKNLASKNNMENGNDGNLFYDDLIDFSLKSKDDFKSNNVTCLLALAIKYLSESWYTTFTSHKKEDFKYLANIFFALISKFKKDLYTSIQKKR